MGKHLLLVLICFLGQNNLFANTDGVEFNNPPLVIISDPGVTMYPVGGGWVKVDPNLIISDDDSPQMRAAEIVLTNRIDGAFIEELSLSPTGIALITSNDLTLNIEPFPNMTISISGTASLSIYQRILREVQYRNSNSEATPGDRLAIYRVTDDQMNVSEPKSRIIRIEVPKVEIVEVVTNTPENGLFGIGDELNITVKYSGNAFVGEGTPYIMINIGGKEVKAIYVSGSGTDQHIYQYIIEEGDLDMEGVGFADEITLEGAVIVDTFNRETPLQIVIDITAYVDGIRPFVTTIATPADGTYGACTEDQWRFTLTMSEEVTVDLSNGSPTLQLLFNSGGVQATYDATASTSTNLVFNYQIQANDLDPDGIVIARMFLNGSLIRDIAGNQLLDIGFQQTELPDTENILIDTSPPLKPVITGISEDTGISSTDGITNSRNLIISGIGMPLSPLVVFLDGESIGEITVDEEGSWTLDYTAVTLDEGGYIITARSKNDACVDSELSEPFNLIIDLTAPVASITDISATLNESGTVTVLGSDADAGSTDNFTPSSQLTFTLSKDTFTCEDLGENVVEITVTDLSGNSSVMNLTVTVVDNIAPVINVEDITLYLGVDGSVAIGDEEVNLLVSDNCGVETYSMDRSVFSCSDIGTHTVLLTVSDKSGNSNEFEISVTVLDELAPNIENAPVNMIAGSDESGNYILPDFIADLVVSDNCEMESVVQFPAAGSLISGFGIPHPVTITATDIHGNVTEITFTVTLVDRDIMEILSPEVITVPWNTQLENLPLPVEVTVTLQNGDVVQLQVTWDIQHFDPIAPGVYQNGGTLTLLSDVFNPENLQPTITVIIEDKPLPLDIELDNAIFNMRISSNTSIGNFHTIDPSDDYHEYHLTGSGGDDGLFRIVDGALYWNSPDFHPGRTQFTITVSSTDRMGNVIIRTFNLERILEPLSDLRLINVFTPNNDGVNDTWGAEALGFYGKVRIMIYERSGKRVYYSTDPTERWDGKADGKDVLAGTYYYIIEVESTGEIHRSVLTVLRD